MTLSITQRLVLTVTLLAGLVIAPACILFYRVLLHNSEARALDQAHAQAMEIEYTLWSQLDPDLLFDFVGQRLTFDQLNIPNSDWALRRGDGRVETGAGIFVGTSSLPRMSDRMIYSTSHRRYAIATVPLIPERPLAWTDLPQSVRDTIENQVPEDTFLWAERGDVLDQNNTFIVQMLGTQHILNFSVTDHGQCLKVTSDPLAETLPQGMDEILAENHGIKTCQITGWYIYQGQLIADVVGQDPNHAVVRLGVNRLGQEYELDQNGRPVTPLESSQLYVMAALDISQEGARTAVLGRGILFGGLGIWGLMVLVAWLVTKRALHPVDDMVRQADRIMPSKLYGRLPVSPATDELSRLARTVNHMLDRLQQGYLREQQFTGDVSHEMRNPLAKMIAEIDLALSRDRDVSEYQEILKRLKGYSIGMQQLVHSLLMLARLDSGLQELDIHPFEVAELVVETLKTFSQDFATRVQVELGPSVKPMIGIGHASLISVLIGNLLDNALRYSPVSSPVFLRIHRRAKTLHFAIEDQGPGIPEDQRTLVFNRFHRLEKSRSKSTGGSGLGLAIAHAIAEVHHMTLDITSATEQGTIVRFSLPAQHD